MLKRIKTDLTVWLRCPEIRSNMQMMWAAKITSFLTLLLFSPMILLGLVCVLIVHGLDFVGQLLLWPGHKITKWLHDFQQTQIREAHDVIPLETIQERCGIVNDEDI